MASVKFIGAGPGDPELITVKAQKAILEADVIIYAGSLVPPQVIENRKSNALVMNSASMNLDEIVEAMKTAHAKNQKVARVHTGDPSIYGSIREQMEELDKLGITYEVIPGVSSFLGAAAVIRKEFTVPGISQTVICTRMEGRTPVPELEQIEKLASHKTSMAIFLSVGMIEVLAERLSKHYRPDTPMAVVQRATWADQKIVKATLDTIVEKVKAENITKTAMILIGDFLGDAYENSLLYAKHFSHEFRKGTN
ncbi:MAG: precorrin-4 C(11)-methyltransferase [Bacteroidia bacterium]|nr:MAG: precorrin-4 C(11)-methyltransferase [Bacteroidia bacterium]